MKFGVYGCRHMHIAEAVQQLLELGHVCIGVFEQEGAQAQKLVDNFNLKLIKSETDFFDAAPELVLCAAINNRKIDIIETCEKKGLDIMLDKPAVICRNGYERLETIICRGKIKVGMMFTERFNPAIHALRNAIESGVLGKVVSLSFSKPHKLAASTRDSWHFDKAQNGGPIMDLIVHDFDLLHVLTGSDIAYSTSVLGVGNRKGFENFYDDAKVLAVMKNGVAAFLTADWWTPDTSPCFGNGRIICTGTLGRCEVYTTGDPLFYKEPFAIISNEEYDEKIMCNIVPTKNLMQDFLSYIVGEPSDITGEDILKASYACLIADEQAKKVTVKEE